jgi:hypothetical protein
MIFPGTRDREVAFKLSVSLRKFDRCYSASVRDWTDDQFIPANFAGIDIGADDLTFTRLQFIGHIVILKWK